jgi:hypothetical protein
VKGEIFIENAIKTYKESQLKYHQNCKILENEDKKDEVICENIESIKCDKNEFINCKICMSFKADVSVFPCGHLFSCVKCIFELDDKCSICRQAIKNVAKIFY